MKKLTPKAKKQQTTKMRQAPKKNARIIKKRKVANIIRNNKKTS